MGLFIPPEDPRQVLHHLHEHFPDGSARAMLHGLVLCVRRRCRGARTLADIARRARATETNVARVIRGEFGTVQWGSIESVLKGLEATHAELAAAGLLYDQARQITPGTWWTTGPGTWWEAGTSTWWTTPHPPTPPHDDHGLPAGLPGAFFQPLDPYAQPPAVDGDEQHQDDQDDGHREDAGDDEDGERRGGEGQVPSPNPMAADTPAEFVTEMKKFRASKGSPPLRTMQKQCERLNRSLTALGKDPVEHRTHASFSNIGKNDKLPSLPTTRSFIVGAGGDHDDLELWEKAWKRLAMKLQDDAP